MNTCKTCAWFCHGDGKCYGGNTNGNEAMPVLNTGRCTNWTFDGLEEWERVMETKTRQFLTIEELEAYLDEKLANGEITVEEAENEWQDWMHKDEVWNEW